MMGTFSGEMAMILFVSDEFSLSLYEGMYITFAFFRKGKINPDNPVDPVK